MEQKNISIKEENNSFCVTYLPIYCINCWRIFEFEWKILEKSETLKKKVFSLSLFSYKWNPISCVENNILRWKFNSFLFTLHWFFETPILKIIASYSYIHTMYKYIRHMFKHSFDFLKTKMKTGRRRKMMYLTGIWNNKISYKRNQLSRLFFSDPMYV